MQLRSPHLQLLGFCAAAAHIAPKTTFQEVKYWQQRRNSAFKAPSRPRSLLRTHILNPRITESLQNPPYKCMKKEILGGRWELFLSERKESLAFWKREKERASEAGKQHQRPSPWQNKEIKWPVNVTFHFFLQPTLNLEACCPLLEAADTSTSIYCNACLHARRCGLNYNPTVFWLD